MTANKMPEMPFSPYLISEWTGPEMTDRKTWTAYTADQMRAMSLSGLEAAKAAFASEWPNGEFRLWDSQWVNCVNHEHAYENSDKQDAVAQAVKLAEKYMGKNIEVALTNLTALEQEAKK